MSSTMRALRVVALIGALPATVVTPSTLACRAATTSAIASSWPGSQSMIIGIGLLEDVIRKTLVVCPRSAVWAQ